MPCTQVVPEIHGLQLTGLTLLRMRIVCVCAFALFGATCTWFVLATAVTQSAIQSEVEGFSWQHKER